MVALLIAVIGITGIRNMSIIDSNEVSMYNKDLTGIKDIASIKSNLIQINFDIYKVLHDADKSNIKNLMNDIERLKDEDDRLISDYEKTIYDDDNRAMLIEFSNILKEYRTYRAELFDDINNNKMDDALVVYVKLDEVSNKIVHHTDSIVKNNEKVASETYNKNSSLYKTTRTLNAIIIILGLFLAVVLGVSVASTISNQLEKVLDFAQALSSGDLEKSIEIESKDEIGSLAKALNTAADIRKQYELKLEENYQELEASYEEVTALESDLREKYQELESSFEEITALEQELREKYEEIAVSEESLRESDEWYKLITDASYDALWDWHIKEDKIYMSDKWNHLLGCENGQINSSEKWFKFIHPEDVENVRRNISEHWKCQSDTFSIQYRIMLNNQSSIWILTTGKILYDQSGQPYRSAGSHKDITVLIKSREKLEHMAYHDYLTDLPNRQYLHKKLTPEFTRDHSTDSCNSAAVIFIDIDNFKYINDTLGHSFGDIFIKSVGERILYNISSNDTLIRLGGDEFIIFARDFSSKEYIGNLAKAILMDLNRPFDILNNSMKVTASIGIALYPEDGTKIDDLLKKADIAMYKSKYSGKNKYTFFVNTMNDEIVERMNIEKHLEKALLNEEFILFYQPQVEIETGEITGFEALIRWNSPELGFISPLKFITIAEENNMIIDIGNWVLNTACRFMKKVHDYGKTDSCISVNVSILQLVQSDFVENISKVLEEVGLEPRYLELEITESVFIDSYEVIRRNMEDLKALGVKIALDDFGKGYSSLSYLKQLPIDTLKIDKSFVDDIHREIDKSLVENIILIGHKMNLNVIAEGVELENQARYLKEFQCDKIQGYLYSRPVSGLEALKLIET